MWPKLCYNNRMKRLPTLCVLTAISLASAPVAFAHPGHEGHDLTWDFGHLAAYPLATLGCFTVFSALAWIGWRLLRPRTDEQRGKTAAAKASRQDR